jgi:hypothetical protein
MRTVSRTTAVALIAVALVVSALAAPAEAAKRPDIVLVVLDDMRVDDLPYMPATRRLVIRRGVRFANAYSVSPQCCPSRASMLTGNYPHTTGVWDNVPPHGGWESFRDDERDTIATRLRRSGYRTAMIGKYLAGYADRAPRRVPPGWDHWAVPVKGEFQVRRPGGVQHQRPAPLPHRLAGQHPDLDGDLGAVPFPEAGVRLAFLPGSTPHRDQRRGTRRSHPGASGPACLRRNSATAQSGGQRGRCQRQASNAAPRQAVQECAASDSSFHRASPRVSAVR